MMRYVFAPVIGVLLLAVLATSVNDTAGAAAGAAGAAGAVFLDQPASPLLTAWGHNGAATGAGAGRVRVGKEVLARLDVLQEIRNHSTSERCRVALDAVLEARAQLKLWALKMHMSSVTLPDTLLAGSITDLGDYDGCLSVPEAMYCLVDVEVLPPGAAELHLADKLSPYEPPNGHNATWWDLLQISGNIRRFRRDWQHWAVCVPAECGGAESKLLGAALAEAVSGLGRALQLELRLHLDGEGCALRGSVPRVPGAPRLVPFPQRLNEPVFLIARFVNCSSPCVQICELHVKTIAMVRCLLWMLIATLHQFIKKTCKTRCDDGWDEEVEKEKGWRSTVVRCFAVQNTWKRLLREEQSHIRAIQGIRTITMVCIILGHRCFALIAGPSRNPDFLEDAYNNVLGTYLVNGAIVVSTFFVISGFLDARRYMFIMKKLGEKFNVVIVFHAYLHRYLRIAPALAFVLAVEVFWMPYLGSGPLWSQNAVRFSQDCSRAWWTHLLFINNYYNVNSTCIIPSWFLAADFQLHLATPLVMWLVYRLSRRSVGPGLSLLAALVLLFAVVFYVNNVLLHLEPISHIFPQVMHDWNILLYPSFGLQYVPAHMNAIPFLLGMISGTLLFLAKHNDWQAPAWLRTTLYVSIPLGHILQTATFFSYVLLFTTNIEEAHPLLGLLYGPARMLAFSGPTAWIMYTCSCGFGGIFESFLAWTPFVALGRLTFSVFLTHFTYIVATAGLVRQPEYLTVTSMLLRVLSDVFASFLLGLLFHVAVEGPLTNLQKEYQNFMIRKKVQNVAFSPKTEETAPATTELEYHPNNQGLHACLSPDVETSKV